MNRPSIYIRIITFLLPAILVTVACSQPSRSLTVVTGKVIHGTMAIEGAEIKVYKVEGGSPSTSSGSRAQSREWQMIEESRSGYHGSFRLHLAEGTYRLEARTLLRSGEKDVNLSGILGPLNIGPGKGRVDQLVIELLAGN